MGLRARFRRGFLRSQLMLSWCVRILIPSFPANWTTQANSSTTPPAERWALPGDHAFGLTTALRAPRERGAPTHVEAHRDERCLGTPRH